MGNEIISKLTNRTVGKTKSLWRNISQNRIVSVYPWPKAQTELQARDVGNTPRNSYNLNPGPEIETQKTDCFNVVTERSTPIYNDLQLTTYSDLKRPLKRYITTYNKL